MESRVRWKIYYIPTAGDSRQVPRTLHLWSNPTLNEADGIMSDAECALRFTERDGGTITKIERV